MSTQKNWFKAKRYGWGWTPSTWQGWLSVAVFVSVLVIGSLLFYGGEPETAQETAVYALWFASTCLCLVVLSYKRGEKPGWRWGDKGKHDE